LCGKMKEFCQKIKNHIFRNDFSSLSIFPPMTLGRKIWYGNPIALHRSAIKFSEWNLAFS
jgi:hypothetical protein